MKFLQWVSSRASVRRLLQKVKYPILLLRLFAAGDPN